MRSPQKLDHGEIGITRAPCVMIVQTLPGIVIDLCAPNRNAVCLSELRLLFGNNQQIECDGLQLEIETEGGDLPSELVDHPYGICRRRLTSRDLDCLGGAELPI